ncbi:MAG: hypothetical protein CM1200mP41_12680 [Gammaproteobacteria bacterium]|nr:MAG: hypothetical protein CM1200mP41_12680 [Gammaproteobacteria bacterium]
MALLFRRQVGDFVYEVRVPAVVAGYTPMGCYTASTVGALSDRQCLGFVVVAPIF